MTKREIVKWLEKQENLKLKEAERDYDVKLAKRKQEFEKLLRLDEMVPELAKRLEHVHDLCEVFKTMAENTPGVDYHGHYYGALHARIYHLLGVASARDMLVRSVDDTSAELKAINTQYARDRDAIRKNFDAVIARVRAMGTAKKAAEYLKELGFDLTELMAAEPEVTAIAVPVDTSYLFLRKEEPNHE